MDIRALIGRNFARIRKEKGLTQEQVEERSGFSQQYLSGLERGQRNPTVVSLVEIAQALEVDFRELLKTDAVTKKEAAKGGAGTKKLSK